MTRPFLKMTPRLRDVRSLVRGFLGGVLCIFALGSVSFAQTSSTLPKEDDTFDPLPGLLMLDTARSHTLPIPGPDAGLIHSITLAGAPGKESIFALTPRGTYAYNDINATWERLDTVHSYKATPDLQQPDTGSFLGMRTGRGPNDFDFAVTSRQILVRQPTGAIFQRTHEPSPSPWKLQTVSPSKTLQFAQGLHATAFDSTATPEKNTPPCTLWTQNTDTLAWTSAPYQGTCAPLRDATSSRGASWQDLGVLQPSAKTALQAFIPLDKDGTPLADEALLWRELLRKTRDKTVRSRCAQAVGMLRILPRGSDAPNLIAVGPRTLCVSTDGGKTFDLRDGLFQAKTRGDVVAPLTSVVAFAWPESRSGVRIIAATRGMFRTKAPASRSFGGRLFVSDDLGFAWREITPDINAPGSFLQLYARAVQDKGGQEDTEVWLLTERRGVWKFRLGGLDARPAAAGMRTQPIHQLGSLLSDDDAIRAAGPAGVFSSGEPWAQTTPVSSRALGIRDTRAQNTIPQLWIGTYRGQVLFRSPKSASFDEVIPLSTEPRDIVSTQHTLRTWTPEAPCLTCRLVTQLVPTSVRTIVERGTNPESGYALIDREGVVQRGWSGWIWLTLPSAAKNIEVLGMKRAPTVDSDRVGVMMLVRERTGDTTLDSFALWLHRSAPDGTEGAWSTYMLPKDNEPTALYTTPNKIFVSTKKPSIDIYRTEKGTIQPAESIQLSAPCDLFVPRRDGGVTCISNAPRTQPISKTYPTRYVIADVLHIDAEMLNDPPKVLPSGVPLVLDIQNPTEFAPIHTAAHSYNEVGEQLWVSTGLGVHATVQALFPEKPPTESPRPKTAQDALPFWKTGFFWTLVALSLLILVPVCILLVRRLRTIYKRNDGIDDDPLRDEERPDTEDSTGDDPPTTS